MVTQGPSARDISRQLLRAATSVGANLEEADGAQSRADFISKCCISLKEARESLYWLRLLEHTNKISPEDAARLVDESDQLVAILTTIVRKSRNDEK
jgi:four helix bundle protein